MSLQKRWSKVNINVMIFFSINFEKFISQIITFEVQDI